MDSYKRTESGWQLEDWECSPMRLSNGQSLAPREAMTALGTICGATQKEIAKAMHCSVDNVKRRMQSIYLKTGTSRAVVAMNRLIDEGALHRLSVAVLAVALFNSSMVAAADIDSDIERRGRTRRTTQTRSSRRTRMPGGALSGMFAQLDDWLGGSAGDIFTHADMRAA
jgi:DNA-binding CsgD family transcriptional regulator